MKIIKISTELEMTIHDFPEGTMREQNKVLCELIGNGCVTYSFHFLVAQAGWLLQIRYPIRCAEIHGCRLKSQDRNSGTHRFISGENGTVDGRFRYLKKCAVHG